MSANTGNLIASLEGGLVVSCQTSERNPLHGLEHSVAIAQAAEIGGASGIRADGPEQLAAIRRAVQLPVIGIFTQANERYRVWITPTFEAARALVESGADAVALDGTSRPRAGGETLEEIVDRIQSELRVPVMADVASVEDGVRARDAGVDFLGSSIEGYERPSRDPDPDVALVAALVSEVGLPVIAERHYSTPDHITAAFDAGALAVVVGSAISDPVVITRRLVARTQRASTH
jgi:N-acylglucosamine-6-phosphate 2-epimerase